MPIQQLHSDADAGPLAVCLVDAQQLHVEHLHKQQTGSERVWVVLQAMQALALSESWCWQAPALGGFEACSSAHQCGVGRDHAASAPLAVCTQTNTAASTGSVLAPQWQARVRSLLHGEPDQTATLGNQTILICETRASVLPPTYMRSRGSMSAASSKINSWAAGTGRQ